MLRTQADLVAVDLPAGEAHLGERRADGDGAEVPDQVDVRPQHQAAARRRAAAAAAARIEAELDADRADQSVPPCDFAAEAEEAAVVAADGAVDGRAERQAAHAAVDSIR